MQAQEALDLIFQHSEYGMLGNKKEWDEENFFNIDVQQYQDYAKELLIDENQDFEQFVEQIYQVCIYMLLNDPVLKINIVENFLDRNYVLEYYQKNNYYLIDGFSKENQPSLVIFPPIMRNNFAYAGIKPSVLMLDEEFQNDKILKVVQEKQQQKKEIKKDEQIDEKDKKDINILQPIDMNAQGGTLNSCQNVRIESNTKVQDLDKLSQKQQEENQDLKILSQKNSNKITSQENQENDQNKALKIDDFVISSDRKNKDQINKSNINEEKNLYRKCKNKLKLNLQKQKEETIVIESQNNAEQFKQDNIVQTPSSNRKSMRSSQIPQEIIQKSIKKSPEIQQYNSSQIDNSNIEKISNNFWNSNDQSPPSHKNPPQKQQGMFFVSSNSKKQSPTKTNYQSVNSQVQIEKFNVNVTSCEKKTNETFQLEFEDLIEGEYKKQKEDKKQEESDKEINESRIINQNNLRRKDGPNLVSNELSNNPIYQQLYLNSVINQKKSNLKFNSNKYVNDTMKNKINQRINIIEDTDLNIQETQSSIQKKCDLFNTLAGIKKQICANKQPTQRTAKRQVGKIVNQSFKRCSVMKSLHNESINANNTSSILNESEACMSVVQMPNFARSQRQMSQDYQNNPVINGAKVQQTQISKNQRCMSLKRNMKSVLDTSSEMSQDEIKSKNSKLNSNQSLRYEQPILKLQMEYQKNKTYEKLYKELQGKKILQK